MIAPAFIGCFSLLCTGNFYSTAPELFCCLFFWFFSRQFFSVALAVLELRSACLCLLSAMIKGKRHRCPANVTYFKLYVGGRRGGLGVKGTDWDLVLVPSSWWLTTICNSIFRESVALFWPPLVLHAQGAQKQMLHEIHLKRFFKQISKTKQQNREDVCL